MKIRNGTVGFVEPMLAAAVTKLPEGTAWGRTNSSSTGWR